MSPAFLSCWSLFTLANYVKTSIKIDLTNEEGEEEKKGWGGGVGGQTFPNLFLEWFYLWNSVLELNLLVKIIAFFNFFSRLTWLDSKAETQCCSKWSRVRHILILSSTDRKIITPFFPGEEGYVSRKDELFLISLLTSQLMMHSLRAGWPVWHRILKRCHRWSRLRQYDL